MDSARSTTAYPDGLPASRHVCQASDSSTAPIPHANAHALALASLSPNICLHLAVFRVPPSARHDPMSCALPCLIFAGHVQIRLERARALDARRCVITRDSVCARTGSKLVSAALISVCDAAGNGLHRLRFRDKEACAQGLS